MRVIFDDQLITEKAGEGYYFFYSPTLGEWIKGDESAKVLIDEIIKSEGVIDIEELASNLREHNISESLDIITTWVEQLYKTNLFFTSEQEFEEALSAFKKSYEIPFTQKVMTAYLHLTHRCNFTCVYCYNKNIPRNKSEELSTQQWIDIVMLLKKAGVRNFIFTGGEPLLREDLYDIVSEVKKGGNIHYTNILTNGSLLTEDKIEAFLPLVDEFVISIDSTNAVIHGEARSWFGFSTLLKAVKFLATTAPEKVHTRSVVTKTNVHDAVRTAKILRDYYGVPRHETALFLPNTIEEIPLVPDLSDAEKMEGELVLFENREIVLRNRIRCGAATSVIAVDMKGDIYPCQSLIDKEFRMGNMFDDDWEDNVLSSPIRETFRTFSVDTRDVHNTCVYRYLCGGGCPALAWRLYRKLDVFLPFLCPHMKMYAKNTMLLHKVKKMD